MKLPEVRLPQRIRENRTLQRASTVPFVSDRMACRAVGIDDIRKKRIR